jgi:hypothetical protein
MMMTPKAVLKELAKPDMLLPGASPVETATLENQISVGLPEEIKDLLRFSKGVRLPVGEVRFLGIEGFEFPEIAPLGVPLLKDGGNFWAVDVDPKTGAWGVIFYLSHDPPVAVIQSLDLAAFLMQLLHPGDVGAVELAKQAATEIWTRDPWLKSLEDSEKDPEVLSFAKLLPPNCQIADLRSRNIGSGFSWGRHGPNSEIRRNGALLMFGVCPKPKGLLRRMFRR